MGPPWSKHLQMFGCIWSPSSWSHPHASLGLSAFAEQRKFHHIRFSADLHLISIVFDYLTFIFISFLTESCGMGEPIVMNMSVRLDSDFQDDLKNSSSVLYQKYKTDLETAVMTSVSHLWKSRAPRKYGAYPKCLGGLSVSLWGAGKCAAVGATKGPKLVPLMAMKIFPFTLIHWEVFRDLLYIKCEKKIVLLVLA